MGVSQNSGYLLEGPHNKNYSILGSILGSTILGKYHKQITAAQSAQSTQIQNLEHFQLAAGVVLPIFEGPPASRQTRFDVESLLGVILGLYWGCTGVVLGLYWDNENTWKLLQHINPSSGKSRIFSPLI